MVTLKVIEANAGAGKTTSLVNEYLNFLRKGISVDSIVFITFTEAAAAEIKDKVKKAVESDTKLGSTLLYLPSAPIGTVHSFCYDLLRTFGYRAGVFSLDYEIATSMEVEEFANESVLEALERFSPLPDFQRLLELIDRNRVNALRILGDFLREVILHRTRYNFSGEDFSVEKMVETIEFLYSKLPQKKAVPCNRRFEAEKRGADLLLKILRETLDIYRRKLYSGKRLDYDEILLKASEAVAGNEKFRDELLDHYRVLIIDEFQDTDPVQWSIVESLVKHAVERGKDFDVIVVGDPKQSIYRFRSADILVWKRVLTFLEEFKESSRVKVDFITKSENYRSSVNLIKFFNCFFPKLYRDDSLLSVNFCPFKTPETASDGGEVVIFPVKDRESFVDFSVRETFSFLKEGVVGVIAKTWRHLKPFEAYLKEKGIDFAYLSADPYSTYGAEELINLLEFLLKGDDLSLFNLLSSRMVGLDHTTALVISKEGIGAAPEEVREFIDYLEREKKNLDKELHSTLIFRILLRTGYLDLLKTTDFDSYKALLDILDEVYKLEVNESPDFEELVALLKERKNSGGYGGRSSKPLVKNGFVLTTIHSSKGLEFDAVILCPWNRRRGGWYDPKTGRYFRRNFLFTNLGFAVRLYSSNREFSDSPLFYMLECINDHLEDLENKNLIYVGMTRAKRKLVIGADLRKDKLVIGGEKFGLEEIECGDFLSFKEKTEEGNPVPEKRKFNLVTVPKNLPDFVKVFRPSENKSESLIGEKNPYLPKGLSPQDYGTAVHALCQAFFMGALEDEALDFAAASVMFSSESLRERLKEIYRFLKKHESYLKSCPVKTELPLTFWDGKELVRARVDLIRYLDGVKGKIVEVWDFKTGVYTKEKEEIYFSQLRTYRDLLEKAGFRVSDLALFFVDDGILLFSSKGKFSLK